MNKDKSYGEMIAEHVTGAVPHSHDELTEAAVRDFDLDPNTPVEIHTSASAAAFQSFANDYARYSDQPNVIRHPDGVLEITGEVN